MNGLPFDIIQSIMLTVDPFNIKQKFKLSAISRTWRSVALASPLLWSSFAGTSFNQLRIPIVLERSKGALLRAHLSFTDGVSDNTVTLLALNSNRLLELVLDFPYAFHDIVSPLICDTPYPELRYLNIACRDGSVTGSIFAPKLASLSSSRVVFSAWDKMLSNSLSRVILYDSGDFSVLLSALLHCPCLRKIVFFTSHMSQKPLHFTPLHFDSLRRIDDIELKNLGHDALSVLTAIGDAKALPQRIRVTVGRGHDLRAVLNQIWRSFGNLVSISSNSASLILKDADGLERELSIGMYEWHLGNWNWNPVILALPLGQLRRLSVAANNWSFMRTSSFWPELDELSIYGSAEDIQDYRTSNQDASRTCNFQVQLVNRVTRIRLDIERSGWLSDDPNTSVTNGMIDILNNIALPLESEAVQVCVNARRWCTEDSTTPAEHLENFRRLLNRERI